MAEKVTLASNTFQLRLLALMHNEFKVDAILDSRIGASVQELVRDYWASDVTERQRVYYEQKQKKTVRASRKQPLSTGTKRVEATAAEKPRIPINVGEGFVIPSRSADTQAQAAKNCRGLEFKLESPVYANVVQKMCSSCALIEPCLKANLAQGAPLAGTVAGMTQPERQALLAQPDTELRSDFSENN